MKTENRFTEVCHLSTCMSDYFSGYSYPVIGIPAYNNMTKGDLARDIQSEINATWDYLTYGDKAFTEAEMSLFDDYCKELKTDSDTVIYTCDEIDEEFDGESCYMYFSLCKPVTHYGITFLNE